MMKKGMLKGVALLLGVSMLFSVAGCGKTAKTNKTTTTTAPITSFSPAPTYYKLAECLKLGKYKDLKVSWDSDSGKKLLEKSYKAQKIDKPTAAQTAQIKADGEKDLIWQTILDNCTIVSEPADSVTFFEAAKDLDMQMEMEDNHLTDIYVYLDGQYGLTEDTYPTYRSQYAKQTTDDDMLARAIALAEHYTYTDNDIRNYYQKAGVRSGKDGGVLYSYFGRDLIISRMIQEYAYDFVASHNTVAG